MQIQIDCWCPRDMTAHTTGKLSPRQAECQVADTSSLENHDNPESLAMQHIRNPKEWGARRFSGGKR